MGKSLLIVESPTKVNTLKKIVGKDFIIKASVGHLKDLPKKKLGVDIDNNFEPEYITIRGKGKILQELKTAAKKAEKIYLAPDPDREGEAIAYHIGNEVSRFTKGKIYRVLFNEITKKAVKEALDNPTELNPVYSLGKNQNYFFTHGEKDKRMYASHYYFIKNHAEKNKINSDFWLVKNAGHVDSLFMHPKMYGNKMKIFFEKYLK